MDCKRNECDNAIVTNECGAIVGIPAPVTDLNLITINNSTINNSVINDSEINNPTITGGTIDGTSITDSNIDDSTITNSGIVDSTIDDSDINNPTISGGTLNNTDIYYDGQRFYQRWVVPGVFRAEVLDILTNNVIPIATVNIARWVKLPRSEML